MQYSAADGLWLLADKLTGIPVEADIVRQMLKRLAAKLDKPLQVVTEHAVLI